MELKFYFIFKLHIFYESFFRFINPKYQGLEPSDTPDDEMDDNSSEPVVEVSEDRSDIPNHFLQPKSEAFLVPKNTRVWFQYSGLKI